MKDFFLFLLIWLAGQVYFWGFIQVFVRQQKPVLTVFRDHVKPEEHQYEDALHRWNALMAAWAAILVSLPQAIWGSWVHAILMVILLLPFFSRFYDRGINSQMGNDPDYLGEGAETDQRMKDLFGIEAGRRKNRFCLVLVLLINLAAVVVQIIRIV